MGEWVREREREVEGDGSWIKREGREKYRFVERVIKVFKIFFVIYGFIFKYLYFIIRF